MKKIFFFIIFLISLAVKADVGKLHAIIIVKTQDNYADDAIEGWKISLNKIEDELQRVNSYTRLTVVKHYFTGKNFDRNKVLQKIRSLNVGTNDVIFFYYAGHGYGTNSCVYPNMQMSRLFDENDNELFIENKEVSISGCRIQSILRSKSPRLLISLYETCNAIVEEDSDKDSGMLTTSTIVKNYRVLYEETKGEVFIAAAKQRQSAGWDDEIGGYFTHFFLQQLHLFLKNKNGVKPCDWYSIGRNTIGKVKVHTTNHKDFKNPQILYGEVSILDRYGNELNCKK